MKIPLDWLKDYVDIKKTPKEIGESFTALGLMVDKPFDGKTFDLEHRFDRSDWLSIYGCARDLAAYEGLKLKSLKMHTEEGSAPNPDTRISIRVECPNVIRRFNTRVFRNVKVGKSPEWLKKKLTEYGIPSINNIVDITNLVMVELGQPMHAQDTDKFRKKEIVLRHAKNGEKLTTFLGDEVELTSDAFVLTQDNVPTVLGGIVGGRETGVDENTKNIVLDAGNYDQVLIRKVSRKLKIQNETVLRYDKYLNPELCTYAMQRATELILEIAKGEYYENDDWYPIKQAQKTMTLPFSRIKTLGGVEIAESEVLRILENLSYKLVSNVNNTFTLEVPYFRTDVEVSDDIVSDILRIHGYINIPTTQIVGAPPKDQTPKIYVFEDTLRDTMLKLSGHEHITDPLVFADNKHPSEQVMLENSVNSEKNSLRLSITEGLKQVSVNYVKNQVRKGILFEVGLVYSKAPESSDYKAYKETRVLECLTFNKEKTPKELSIETSSLLATLLKELGIRKPDIKDSGEIIVEEKNVGVIRPDGFTLYTEDLLATCISIKNSRVIYDVQQSISLDISVVASKEMKVGQVISFINTFSEEIKETFVMDEYDSNDDKKQILLRIFFDSKTSQEEVSKTQAQLLKQLPTKYPIQIRK